MSCLSAGLEDYKEEESNSKLQCNYFTRFFLRKDNYTLANTEGTYKKICIVLFQETFHSSQNQQTILPSSEIKKIFTGKVKKKKTNAAAPHISKT